MLQGSGIRDQGSGIRDQGSGIRDQGSEKTVRQRNREAEKKTAPALISA
jgi:hypothetical protein